MESHKDELNAQNKAFASGGLVNYNPFTQEKINSYGIYGSAPLHVSFDLSKIERVRESINRLQSNIWHRDMLNEMGAIPSVFFNKNKNKTVKSFEKCKELRVVCKNIAIKNALMEYARATGVPTICADNQSKPLMPHIGWSGTMICGFEPESNALVISVARFIELCDNWKEAKKPVIKLNHEQTIKIEYDEKIVLAGCNHQYKLPFKLIDEIHAKIHEQDEKKGIVKKFSTYEWMPVYNSQLYYAAVNTANHAGIEFNGLSFQGTNFDGICVYIDTTGKIQWGRKNSTPFTADRELSQSDFAERCLNHNK